MKMSHKNKAYDMLLYVSLLAFFFFAIYSLYINSDVLYTAHDRSEFLFGSLFFDTLMSKPFGFMQFVGAWLTQLFYYPALGAGVQVVIWTLIFFVGIKAFRLKHGAVALMLLPVACLLTSIVDLGYWIYISTIRGYWFSQSIAYLTMLLILWIARSTPRKWHMLWYLFAFCFYPILGWFALLFVLCLMLSDKPSWRETCGVIVIFFAAPIWHTWLYSNLKLDDVILAGLPRFETPSDSSEYLSVPFWLIGMVSVLAVAVGRFLDRWFVPVLCAVAGIAFTRSLMFHDSNYTTEMRMVRYAEADDWNAVLTVFNNSLKPTASMVMLKNVALMNEGGLLDSSFKMGNDAIGIYNPDSLHVSFLEIASPIVYYNYGLLNEGFRLSFECAVQSGFSPFYLKTLSRCAFANGEKALVDRYTAQLYGHPFYSDWQPAPVTDNIRELHNAYPNELTGVENSNRYLVNSVSLWYGVDSKVASEQALFYSIIRCDSRRFWPALRKYVNMHQGEDFPLHAQEAYILFIDKAPEEKRMMLPVSEDVYERYKQFWDSLENLLKSGVARNEIPAKMYNEYGDTYWYYNIFGRKKY